MSDHTISEGGTSSITGENAVPSKHFRLMYLPKELRDLVIDKLSCEDLEVLKQISHMRIEAEDSQQRRHHEWDLREGSGLQSQGTSLRDLIRILPSNALTLTVLLNGQSEYNAFNPIGNSRGTSWPRPETDRVEFGRWPRFEHNMDDGMTMVEGSEWGAWRPTFEMTRDPRRYLVVEEDPFMDATGSEADQEVLFDEEGAVDVHSNTEPMAYLGERGSPMGDDTTAATDTDAVTLQAGPEIMYVKICKAPGSPVCHSGTLPFRRLGGLSSDTVVTSGPLWGYGLGEDLLDCDHLIQISDAVHDDYNPHFTTGSASIPHQSFIHRFTRQDENLERWRIEDMAQALINTMTSGGEVTLALDGPSGDPYDNKKCVEMKAAILQEFADRMRSPGLEEQAGRRMTVRQARSLPTERRTIYDVALEMHEKYKGEPPAIELMAEE